MPAPIFGYHMPNYTFPDVPPSALFEHVAGLTVAAEAAGFDLFEHHCEMVGRDPATITRTIGVPVELTLDATAAGVTEGRRWRTEVALPERTAELLSEYARAGAQGFIFRNPNLSTPEAPGGRRSGQKHADMSMPAIGTHKAGRERLPTLSPIVCCAPR